VDKIPEGSVILVLPDNWYPGHGLSKHYLAAINDMVLLDALSPEQK